MILKKTVILKLSYKFQDNKLKILVFVEIIDLQEVDISIKNTTNGQIIHIKALLISTQFYI